MATAMAALLKPSSSSSSYCRSINGRSIITPPLPTRISFPINRKNPLPKITTATTKCNNSSSSSNRGSTFREEKENTKCSSNNRGSSSREEEEEEEEEEVPFSYEKVKEAFMKAMLKVVKALEKPAVTAILVWVLLTNNPIIASSYASRTAFWCGVWFVYDVCKAIASIRRKRIGDDDDGSIRFPLGNVLGSTALLFSGLMVVLMVVLVVVFIAVFIGILLFICGSAAVILLLMAVFMGMVLGFGEVTCRHELMTEDESVNTTDEQKKKRDESVNTTDEQKKKRVLRFRYNNYD